MSRATMILAVMLLAGCTRFGFGFAGEAGDGPPVVTDASTEVDQAATETIDAFDLSPPDDTDGVLDLRPTDLQLLDTIDIDPPFTGWVTVAATTFSMGSPPDELCREYALQGKETQHSVTLNRSFEIGATEITQKQFEDRMGYNPSSNGNCPDCPVENLSWHEAAAFCNELTATSTNKCYSCTNVFSSSVSCTTAAANIYDCAGYRLPTEAEWELAYRAGSTEATYAGPISDCYGADPIADVIGWFDKNSAGQSQPVAQKQPNSLGLYDMGGNVWEWCHDSYTSDLGSASQTDPVTTSGSSRIGRGGAFAERAGATRAATRGWWMASGRLKSIGFRCARTSN